MISDIQLDSLIMAIKGGWVTLEQVPEELKETVINKMKENGKYKD